jgi:cysteine synthase A
VGVQKKLNDIAPLIGNTPLYVIDYEFEGKEYSLFAKAEYLNFTGSIKDRMAFYIVKKAYESGSLKPGDSIAEATSGNTGIAFSALGRALGHKVYIFMPDWMSQERIKLMESFGAEVVLVSKEQGGFRGSIAMAEQFARDNTDVFLPRQFENTDNCDAHALTTGPEIWNQLESIGRAPDAFVAGVGTGGTVMGVGAALKKNKPEAKIHPLEPANSPTMTTGNKTGAHRIQGISDEFIPPIVNLKELDEIIQVDDGDSILMAQALARTLGIGIGISSGANFLGAVKAQMALGDQAVVTTVFPDDNKKYLSSDLMKEEPVKDGFLSTRVKLLSVYSLRRDCKMCRTS